MDIPAGAKTPQDHKTKGEPLELMPSKTINYEGETYELQSAAVNSLEFLEAMREDDVIGLVQLAITPAGYNRLKDQLRDPETGFCPLEKFKEFLESLMDDKKGPTIAS